MKFMLTAPLVIYIVVYCIYASVWGFAVQKIVENKGYHENWFWWGFFFGILALLVALTKPDRSMQGRYYQSDSYLNDMEPVHGSYREFRGTGNMGRISDVPDGWRCPRCDTVNAGYVGTCRCGCEKP